MTLSTPLPKRFVAAAGLLLTVVAAGCIDKETEQTLYLEPSGELTWVIVEREIHSDDSDLAERRREESEYLDQLYATSHPPAEALHLLGPGYVETTVLRDRRPFAARTEAGFLEVGDAIRAFFSGLGIVSDIELITAGPLKTLAIDVDLAATRDYYEVLEERDYEGGSEELLLELWPGFVDTRFVLGEGEFIYAEGFDLDHEIATPSAWDELFDRDVDRLQLVLSWTTD